MAKDKKKKKSKTKSSAASGLRNLSENPLVADIVAAALVATASALKDSKKARQLAVSAGDELEALSKKGAERGNALWQLALDVGRRAADTLAGETAEPPKRSKASKAAKASKRSTASRSSKATKPAKSSKRTKGNKARGKAH